jgi:hypothetical protein
VLDAIRLKSYFAEFGIASFQQIEGLPLPPRPWRLREKFKSGQKLGTHRGWLLIVPSSDFIDASRGYVTPDGPQHRHGVITFLRLRGKRAEVIGISVMQSSFSAAV